MALLLLHNENNKKLRDIVPPLLLVVCFGLMLSFFKFTFYLQENLLKILYFILNYSKKVGFSISNTSFAAGWKKLPHTWKKYHKNEQHLCLVIHIFIKLSQNVYPTNIHILMYWYARNDCKLWHATKFYCVFWVFWYIIDEYMSGVLYFH